MEFRGETMLKMRPVVTCLLAFTATCAWIAACSSDNNTGPGPSGASGNSGSASGNSGSASGNSGSASGSAPSDGGGSDAHQAGGLGFLVDNMTAALGTRISLQVPPGESPGSYYTYNDNASNNLGMSTRVFSTAQLLDAPIDAGITNADGSQIIGEICFGGTVVTYSGLGMTLAYGNPPDASPESGLSIPVPFDASAYSGVSFYIFVEPSDSGLSPTIHFSVPDTQTADPLAWPAALCDIDGGKCDDDFGADVTTTAGAWTKATFAWGDLREQGFGIPAFQAIKTNQLIGMKWQTNGAGPGDADAESFNFCISDIYFTP
jgi:hypothetical protein